MEKESIKLLFNAFNARIIERNSVLKDFQKLRAQYYGRPRIGNEKFWVKIDHDGAHHHGGQKEFQFALWNYDLEGLKSDALPRRPHEYFMYGFSFNCHAGISNPYPLRLIEPLLERYNKFIRKYPDYLKGYKLYIKNYNEKMPSSEILYVNKKILKSAPGKNYTQLGYIFIGKYLNRQGESLTNGHIDMLIEDFEYLLPVYQYVQFGDESALKKSIIALKSSLNNQEYSTEEILNHLKITADASSRSFVKNVKRTTKETEVEVKQLHLKISIGLEQELRKQFENVSIEKLNLYGRIIDIVVCHENKIFFYEIKTYDNIISCIREALSQLIEYSYYPQHKLADKLFIVSQHKTDRTSKKYILHIRETLQLPVYYLCFDYEQNLIVEEV